MTIAAAITWIGSFVPTKVKNYFVKPTTSAAVANGEARAMVPRRGAFILILTPRMS